MKRKLAMIMTTTLLVLSLSACGSSSEEAAADSGEAVEAENAAAESTGEIQAADESANAQTEAVPTEGAETVPAEGTETTPAEGTETTPAEGTETTPAEGTQDAAAASGTVSLEGGGNQAEAVPIEVGQQVQGTNEDTSWYCFTTGSDPDVDYRVTIINMSGDGEISVSLRDLFGDQLAYTQGGSDGTAATCSSDDKLDANTEYYIVIGNYRGGPLDYSLTVREAKD